MKVLFIGGTGIISSACTALAVAQGIDLYILNRGKTSTRPVPEHVKILTGDIRDHVSANAALADHQFDVAVDWVAFTPDHIENDLTLFQGRTKQYIFISSASAYQKPPSQLPITESTPLHNPYWAYSRNKIACEERLTAAYRQNGFPITIVRPTHTYDKTLLPLFGAYTVIDRMRRGKKIIIHGDGTSLWTMTHHRDFAKGFIGLLGNPQTIGHTYHITSDEQLTWNQIAQIMADAAGGVANIVHMPSSLIAKFHQDWGDSLLGDKTHSMVFDNRKIKRLVPDFTATIPFAQGIREIIAWYDADPTRQKIDEGVNQLLDKMIATYEQAFL